MDDLLRLTDEIGMYFSFLNDSTILNNFSEDELEDPIRNGGCSHRGFPGCRPRPVFRGAGGVGATDDLRPKDEIGMNSRVALTIFNFLHFKMTKNDMLWKCDYYR